MAPTPTVVIVAPTPHRERDDPDAVLAKRTPLVQWASAIREAGARAVTVVQRHPRSLTLPQNGVDYVFVGDALRLPAPLAAPVWNERAARAVRALSRTSSTSTGWSTRCWCASSSRGSRAAFRSWSRTTAASTRDRPASGASPGARCTGSASPPPTASCSRRAILARPWRDAGIIDGRQPIDQIAESSTRLAAEAGADADAGLPGEPALLWVGRLDANKDPLTVLAAFEAALPSLPGAALTMVFSEEPLLADVRRRIAASPALAGRVHLRGRVAHAALAPLYASADLFVLASHHESCGFALLEALSFGVTPVVTDIPAFRALTEGGRVGALVPVGDAAALARAIERLGRDQPRERAERRARVRDHFARALAWPAIGRRALEIYAAAVAAQERR